MNICDWVNLPDGTATESLWCSLRDAELLSIHSDLRHRMVFMTFAVPHLSRFHNLPAELRFIFRAEGVQSARVLRWNFWVGFIKTKAETPAEPASELRPDYRASWREQSDSWDHFEQRLLQVEEPPVISAALLAASPGQLALKIGLNTDGHEYVELIVRSESISVFRTDGKSIDLAQFQRLGEEYWDRSP